MSALALEWVPGATPGAHPFENELADLAMCGVSFAPEQIALLSRGSLHRQHTWWDRLYALTLLPMNDPAIRRRPDSPRLRELFVPSLTWDPDDSLTPVLVPAVVEIDCSEWETFDEREPGWRRFPSLLGRTHFYDSFSGDLIDSVEPKRLWNLWPLEEHDVELVQDAQRQWLKNEWKPWLSWLEVRDNDDTLACDFEGTPAHLHDHHYDPSGFVTSCENGDVWFDHYRDQNVVLDEAGDPYHVPFGPVTGLHHLGPAWEYLLLSSRANTHAAMTAYSPEEQAEVARTERHYSPWLWSS